MDENKELPTGASTTEGTPPITRRDFLRKTRDLLGAGLAGAALGNVDRLADLFQPDKLSKILPIVKESTPESWWQELNERYGCPEAWVPMVGYRNQQALNILFNERDPDFNGIESLAYRIKGEKVTQGMNLNDPTKWPDPLKYEAIGHIWAIGALPDKSTLSDILKQQGYNERDIAFYSQFASMFLPGGTVPRKGHPTLGKNTGFEMTLDAYLAGREVPFG